MKTMEERRGGRISFFLLSVERKWKSAQNDDDDNNFWSEHEARRGKKSFKLIKERALVVIVVHGRSCVVDCILLPPSWALIIPSTDASESSFERSYRDTFIQSRVHQSFFIELWLGAFEQPLPAIEREENALSCLFEATRALVVYLIT